MYQLLICLTVICVMNKPADNTLSIPPVDPVEMCWPVTCLPYYIQYNFKIFKKINTYRWVYMDLYKFSYAMKYFPMKSIPVNSIEKALIMCKKLDHKTMEECKSFLDTFSAMNYTIDVVSDFCMLHLEICLEPDRFLFLTYDQHVKFEGVKLNFYDCLRFNSDEDPFLVDNLKLATILAIPREIRLENRCDCFQVHALGNAYRSINARLNKDKSNEGIFPKFEKLWYTHLEYILMSICATTTPSRYPKPAFRPQEAIRVSKKIANLLHLLTNPYELLVWILTRSDLPIDLSTFDLDSVVEFYSKYYDLL